MKRSATALVKKILFIERVILERCKENAFFDKITENLQVSGKRANCAHWNAAILARDDWVDEWNEDVFWLI